MTRDELIAEIVDCIKATIPTNKDLEQADVDNIIDDMPDADSIQEIFDEAEGVDEDHEDEEEITPDAPPAS